MTVRAAEGEQPTDTHGRDSALLVVSDLSVTYGGSFPAVKSVSFSIDSNSTLALVGESGAGKTTIALAVSRLLPSDAETCGDVRLAGRSLLALTEPELRETRRRLISIVFQDPVGSLIPSVRVGKQIARVVAHRMNIEDRATVRESAYRLLQDVGLENIDRVWDAYPRELSGGMCQRVMIALALSNDPSLVIADEPLSALDAISQVSVLRLLLELQQKLQFAMLYVTHDLRVAARFEQIGVLKSGQLVDLGPRRQILDNPSSEYTRQLLAAARTLSVA